MQFSVFFSAFALVTGVFTSIYLLIAWLKHSAGRRPWFLLLWAIALFLMYWFQLPLILTNLGRVITVTDFNLFFALTLPLTFIALVLIYAGIVDVLGISWRPRAKMIFVLWALAAVIFFGYQFIVNKGIIRTHALPLVGNLVFYAPIRLLILFTIARWLLRTPGKTLYGMLGAAGVMLESIHGIIRNVMVVSAVLIYPPEFWYVALSSLKTFFILQTTSILLLIFGFCLLCQAHHRRYTIQGSK